MANTVAQNTALANVTSSFKPSNDIQAAALQKVQTAFGYVPPVTSQNASPVKATTPVITAQTAQNDLAEKQKAFETQVGNVRNQQQILDQNKAQANQIAQQQAQQKQDNELKQRELANKEAETANKAAALDLTKSGNFGGQQFLRGKVIGSATPTNEPAPIAPQQNLPNKFAGGLPAGYTYDEKTGTAVPTGTQTNATYEKKVAYQQSVTDQAYTDWKSMTDQVRNGTFPLSPTEQALLSATQASLDRAKAEQQTANQAYTGQVSMAQARGGQEYTPIMSGGAIANAISYGVAKIANLDAQGAKVLADLQQSFMDKDYKMINDQYDRFTKLQNDKTTTLTKMHEDVVAHEKDLRDYNLNVQKFQETKSQDAFDNAYKMENIDQQRKDFALKQQTENFKEKQAGLGMDENGNVTHPVVATDPTGKPVAADQVAFLAKLPPATATMVKNLADYQSDPKNLSIRNNARQNILALVHQYDPSYNEGNFTTVQAVRKDYTSGATAKNIQALNTSVNHLQDLAVNFKNLPNSDITKFNTIKDWFSANVGKGDVTKVVTDLNAVSGELAKTFKGTGATDQEVSNIEKGININSSPEQFKSFIEEATKLLGGRLNALNDAYATATGKPFERNFLGADTQNKLTQLKNSGFNIEVPGVLYTDPQAYVKFDPQGANNLKTVVSTYPNLSQADALQLAQSLGQ